MYISQAKILNYRALQNVSIPLKRFSVLLGENDVGKTSVLYALDSFFKNKKISDKDCFFKRDTSVNIKIELSFDDIPDDPELKKYKNNDNNIIISKEFEFDKTPLTTVKLDDNDCEINKNIQKKWFSYENFHFIPVRRDLNVQFSMNKTALLGKTLRAKMKNVIKDNRDASESLEKLQESLKESIKEPQDSLQQYLREQLHNQEINLLFDDINVDPVEGFNFSVRLSDDRVEDILIENRGAGTQNNLIIALFRLIADMKLGEFFIFVMEEPENSLHPKAQRQLLTVLQEISQESQIIVTTHSPVFLERSKFENNIILSRTIHGNTIAKTFNIDLIDKLRVDLGIRPSDALLKGGGNCAILVEGNTEEEGFPVFMEMLGLSEFQLGIAIINMRGCDSKTAVNISRLLLAYDIPCVIILDNNAKNEEEDIKREADASLPNVKKVFRLKKGNIEDYYPLDIVAEVINSEFSPKPQVLVQDFDSEKHGRERLDNFKKVMYDHEAGSSIGYLKRHLGSVGTKMMRDQGIKPDNEIKEIFNMVKKIVDNQ